LKKRGRAILGVRFRNKGLKRYLYMFFVNFFVVHSALVVLR